MALGFARLKDFQEDRSRENRAALESAVNRRDRFVEELLERQKDDRDDLPEVFSGSLEQLLYGSRNHLAIPFRTLPKGAEWQEFVSDAAATKRKDTRCTHRP